MNTWEKNRQLISYLHIGLGVSGIVSGLIALLIIAGAGLISGDPAAMSITKIIAVRIFSILFLLSAPNLIIGIGHMQNKDWSTPAIMVLACINLANIPFGTVVSGVTIWAWFEKDQTVQS